MNFLEDQVNTQLYYVENGINNQYKKFRLREQAKQRRGMEFGQENQNGILIIPTSTVYCS